MVLLLLGCFCPYCGCSCVVFAIAVIVATVVDVVVIGAVLVPVVPLGVFVADTIVVVVIVADIAIVYFNHLHPKLLL